MTMTKDEIRAEIERLEAMLNRDYAKYDKACEAYLEAYRNAPMTEDQDYKDGLIAA